MIWFRECEQKGPTMAAEVSKKTILETALLRARNGGLRAVVIEDIAKDLKTTPDTIKADYTDRDALWLAVLSALQKEQRHFLAALGPGENPRQRLSLFMDSFVEAGAGQVVRGSFLAGLLQDVQYDEGALTQAARQLVQEELDLVVDQFNMMGMVDERFDLSHRLIGAVHGVTLLADALDDPQVLRRQIMQLKAWVRSM